MDLANVYATIFSILSTILFGAFFYIYLLSWLRNGKKSFPMLGSWFLFFILMLFFLRLSATNAGQAMTGDTLYNWTQHGIFKNSVYFLLLVAQACYLISLLHNSRYIRCHIL